MPATISRVRLAAAHEGTAELIVSVRFDTGGTTEVPLDRHASEALLQACSVDDPDQLVGQSWIRVRDALSSSFNRFHQPIVRTVFVEPGSVELSIEERSNV